MLDKFSRLIHRLYRGSREQPVSEYQDFAFEQLKSVIPFDSALWLTGTLDNNHHATIHGFHAHRLPSQVVADWARVSQGRAVLTERVFRSPGTTFNCVAAVEFAPELLQHSRRYNIEHLLATTSVNPVSRLNELISIYRAAPDKPFSEEERLAQQSIIPHLAETWHINRMHHMHLTDQPSRTALAYTAMADRKGVLHLIDPGFTELLLDEWPDWQGPALPEELVRATGNEGMWFSGKSLVTRFMESGNFLLLRARKKNILDNLSKREREVANHFSSGRTNKEIAQSLNLSPSTIRNHLSMIYAKLGIGNKTELVNLFKGQNLI